MIKQLALVFAIAPALAVAADGSAEFTDEELAVAKFWEQMGPTLRDEGIEAYAIRYHEDFSHWVMDAPDRLATKESAVTYYGKYHDAGHRITCAHVEPISVDIRGDFAITRMIYEQTDSYADGRIETNAWRMVGVFERYNDTWQALSTNMATFDGEPNQTDADTAYTMRCPAGG